MKDFLEQLAEADVPPPPVQFGDQLHERVNRSLLLVQLLELACGAIPWAILHLGQALGGAVRLTLTGKYDEGGRDRRSHRE